MEAEGRALDGSKGDRRPGVTQAGLTPQGLGCQSRSSQTSRWVLQLDRHILLVQRKLMKLL